jgi:hypothetical protein
MKAGCTHKDTMQQQRHYPFSDGHPPFTADKTTPKTAAIHRLSSRSTRRVRSASNAGGFGVNGTVRPERHGSIPIATATKKAASVRRSAGSRLGRQVPPSFGPKTPSHSGRRGDAVEASRAGVCMIIGRPESSAQPKAAMCTRPVPDDGDSGARNSESVDLLLEEGVQLGVDVPGIRGYGGRRSGRGRCRRCGAAEDACGQKAHQETLR